ncbi:MULTISPECIES: helix-turn-helix domain-containing protein [Blautia]|uniref:helix-turn-helix domain-containing protein n=1 Tax=Blautia TaxID=572511 RepID=UPI000BA429E6|nr:MULTISPECIES: helix-turn-helix domain-containing protein [Blautia]
MSKEKQILQLLRDGHSQRRIADMLSVSRNTVAKTAKAAMAHPVAAETIDDMDEQELYRILFPESVHIPVLVM